MILQFILLKKELIITELHVGMEQKKLKLQLI